MKKLLLFLIFLTLILPINVSEGMVIQNPLEHDTFEQLIGAIINILWVITLVVAPLMIIIGAYYLLTSEGNPENIKKGWDVIKYAIIGLIVIILADGIITMIERRL